MEPIITETVENFNPLRREGGDTVPVGHPGYQTDFNPLRREGGDEDTVQEINRQVISIHSAARAETQGGLPL